MTPPAETPVVTVELALDPASTEALKIARLVYRIRKLEEALGPFASGHYSVDDRRRAEALLFGESREP